MKRFKLLISILITIIITIFMQNYSYAGTIIAISENDMSARSDIYCIAGSKDLGGIRGLGSKFNFEEITYVDIEGKVSTGENGVVIEHDNNAIIAAILGGALQQGYGRYNHYHEAQAAIYCFWNDWAGTVGAAYGFSPDSGNANEGNKSNGTAMVIKAQAAAATQDYKVRIYLLKASGADAAYNPQELIRVEATTIPDEPNIPTTTPGKTTVKGQINISGYVWEDIYEQNKANTADSKYGNGDLRLEGIRVRWIGADGTELGSATTDSNGEYKLSTDIDLYNHPYGIKDKTKYDNINNSYIEFDYNGLKYTTVAYNGNLSDATSSKGIEMTGERKNLDDKFDKIEDENIYDGNGSIGTLPNSDYLSANYLDQFKVFASTGRAISGLLTQAESNGTVNRKDFCGKHCTVSGLTHLVYTAEDSVYIPSLYRAPVSGVWHSDDMNGDGIIDSEEGYWDPEPDSGDNGYRTVYTPVYCNGVGASYPSEYAGYLNKTYTAPKGNEFNNYEGFHYYDAGEIDGPTTQDCLSKVSGIYEWNIENMNLGLVKREQPDLAIISDIEKVDVIMKGQQYTYYYGERGILNQIEGDLDAFKVKYEFKDVPGVYQRPINPSAIAEIQDKNHSNDLKVYVTYNIRVKNETNTLIAKLNKIVNYFDGKYKLSDRDGVNSNWSNATTAVNGYNQVIYDISSSPKIIEPGQMSDAIVLELEVTQGSLIDLINGDQELRDVSEIYSYATLYGANTICAEAETASAKGLTNSQYAGIDFDSTAGNVVPGNEGTYKEDDTDTAPYFKLTQDEYKIVSGTVYEDKNIVPEDKNGNNERKGNGLLDNGENGVKNVKVELYKVKDDGTLELAKLYSTNNKKAIAVDAITYTDENGYYKFGTLGEIGVTEDNYVIKYTYGNNEVGYTQRTYEILNKEETITSTTSEKNKITTIKDDPINARNYKSTIITNDTIKGVMQGNGNDKWHLGLQDGVSVAVDDLKERLSIESLTYNNFGTANNMSAYSRPFKIQIQYTTEQNQNVNKDGNPVNGDQFKHESSVFDFGIIERPRENIVINKTVENLKITLANGQILIDGNPYKDGQKLDYVQALGPKYSGDKPEQATVNNRDKEKLLKIEMDSELLQGARIDLLYAITVTNNSEIDYEYEHNYTDIDQSKNYITTNSGANYYYYGDPSGLSLIKPSVELVAEYVDPELTVDLNNEINNAWTKVSVENVDTLSTGTVLTRQHLSEDTINAVKDDKYLIFTTTGFSDVERGTSKTINLLATKLLANQEDEYTYENHVEILQLNGKIARTIGNTDNGKQVEKEYKSGNYVPSRAAHTVSTEQDDDMITVTITPPTGLLAHTMIYVIVGIIGLTLVSCGIYFIKRNILGR